MYVCLCSGVTERQIIQEVCQGNVCSMADLGQQLGVAQNCGCCCEHAQQVLEQARRQTQQMANS